MKGKIIVEEGFRLPEQSGEGAAKAGPGSSALLDDQLLDIESRIAQMDAAGVELQILSLTSPGAQGEFDPDKAEALAVRANDYIAEKIKMHPTRLAAYGAVSLHTPEVAVKETRRCINELGFCGILVNDFQSTGPNGDVELYLDDPRFDPFWAVLEELAVPLYIHPRIAAPSVFKHLFKQRSWLASAAWGFASGVSIHLLGIICAGVFDRFPKIQVVVGHLGEHIPADLWRVDHKLGRDRYSAMPMSKNNLVRDYFASNIHITTSGNFSDRALLNCIAELGSDRIIFAVDYPYEDALGEGCTWFDNAPISHPDLLKIGRTNAIKLFKLDKLHGLKADMTCAEAEIGGLKGLVYPDHAPGLRALSQSE